MEYRQLGGSGFRVPVFTLGSGTFGGGNEFFKHWGTVGAVEAARLVAVCLDAGLTRAAAHRAYCSLIGRDYEWELMPLGVDQGVGAVVWSPLGWARLTGKYGRGRARPAVSRLHDKTNLESGPQVSDEYLYKVID